MKTQISKAKATLLGLAIGDALGTTGALDNIGTFPEADLSRVNDKSYFMPGKWSDDTSLALCIADSLLECKGFDPNDQMIRYSKWMNDGYRSSMFAGFDIGFITKKAIQEYEISKLPFTKKEDQNLAGNGSIMRLAPIPIYFLKETDSKLLDYLDQSSRTTHGAPVCREACQFMGLWIRDAIYGASKVELFSRVRRYINKIELHNQIEMQKELKEVISGRFASPSRTIVSSGYVVETLEVALWSLYRTDSFEAGMISAIELPGDSDTCGAVYGQLAGCVYDLPNIPDRWKSVIYLGDEIQDLAMRMVADDGRR